MGHKLGSMTALSESLEKSLAEVESAKNQVIGSKEQILLKADKIQNQLSGLGEKIQKIQNAIPGN